MFLPLAHRLAARGRSGMPVSIPPASNPPSHCFQAPKWLPSRPSLPPTPPSHHKDRVTDLAACHPDQLKFWRRASTVRILSPPGRRLRLKRFSRTSGSRWVAKSSRPSDGLVANRLARPFICRTASSRSCVRSRTPTSSTSRRSSTRMATRRTRSTSTLSSSTSQRRSTGHQDTTPS